MSWKGIFQKAGFRRPDGVNLRMAGRFSAGNIIDRMGRVWYVDRNMSASGDGRTAVSAFLTIGEGIAMLNSEYTAGRRNQTLVIGEGWYSETTMTLKDITMF